MDGEQTIPTRLKSKIPHTLSYPVGAKVISSALAGVPQFALLTIDFRSSKYGPRPGVSTEYPVITAQFSGPGFYEARWSIIVNPVPRSLRHLIHDKVISEALPAIKAWLIANPHSLDREGGHEVVFAYSELAMELTSQEHASLEWRTPENR